VGVVFTRLGQYDMLDIHPVVPALLELRGYPLYITSIRSSAMPTLYRQNYRPRRALRIPHWVLSVWHWL